MRVFGLEKKLFLKSKKRNALKLLMLLLLINTANHWLKNGAANITLLTGVICLLAFLYVLFIYDIYQLKISESSFEIIVLESNIFGNTRKSVFKKGEIKSISLKKTLIKKGKVDLKLRIETDSKKFEVVSKWNGFNDDKLKAMYELIQRMDSK